MTICKQCSNAESLGGKCREFQASDGHYTWGTPIFQDDDELERLVSYQGGTFNSEVTNCGNFIQKQCEFAQLGAYAVDCHCDRACKWGAAGAYLAVCSDPTKSFEAPQWMA
ncbi:MAG: hypothetical protein ACEQSC_01415 [Candidatus Nanopelagicaceae bacterium]